MKNIIKNSTQIFEKSMVTEQEINKIKNRLNSEKINIADLFFEYSFELTTEQTQKGIQWLLKQIDTKKNKRKIEITKDLTSEHIRIINEFDYFMFEYFVYDSNNWFSVYSVHGYSGDKFEYYFNNNKIIVVSDTT